ncbi:MAG: alpha/beta fold hydrolase [Candidatus Methylomirabilis sp.]|nr:alpha/beta fold hydrolase [Deltaproteobacteria bacterium]
MFVSIALVTGGATECGPNSQPLAPVLMVHGMGGSPKDFTDIRAWLIAQGYRESLLRTVKLSDSVGCMEQSAVEVAAAVETLARETGAPKVDVIAHSLGGLIVRYYAKNLGGDGYLRNVVTLSTPHHGTALAKPNPWFCGVTQTSLGSAFLTALNAGDETPGEDVLYTAVWSPLDGLILPAESALLGGDARNIRVEENHLTILRSTPTYDAIRGVLLGGENG